MTLEHLIPESLGGKLTSRFLCKACNSRLGHSLEGHAKKDPTIRQLVAKLGSQIPKLATELEEGQSFVTVGPGGSSKGRIKNGNFVVHAAKLADGSLIQETHTAAKTIRKLLEREGLTELQVALALQTLANASENVKLSLSPAIDVVKWSGTGIRALLDGPMLNNLIPVKSAYEFLALHVGTAIYQNTPPLTAIRSSLHSGRMDSMHIEVERLQAPDAKAFHGLVFEGNQPYAKVQVRIFGQLAFRVHFKTLSIGGPRAMYTHDLRSGEEVVQQLPASDD